MTPDTPAIVETRVVHAVHRRATSVLADAIARHADRDAITQLRRFVVGMLHHHHEGEDHDLWPLLVAADPRLADGLGMLSAEHEQLNAALDALNAADIDEDADRLGELAVAVRDLIHDHLAHEEPILLPGLRAHISDATWDQFSARMVAMAPPEGNELMVALLDEVGTPTQVELVLRHLPAVAREQLPAIRAQAKETLDALEATTADRRA